MTDSALMITNRLEDPAAPDAPPGTIPLSCRFILPGNPSSVGRARRIAAETLRHAGRNDLSEILVLVLSELATNAVNAIAAAIMAPAPITVVVRCVDPSAVHLRVTDPAGGRIANPGRPRDAEECGRGLYIVDAVCARWGVTPGADGGKCVWADVAAEPGAHDTRDNCANVTRPSWIPSPGDLVTDQVSGLPAVVREFWKLPHCTLGVRLAEPGDDAVTWIRALTSLRPPGRT